ASSLSAFITSPNSGCQAAGVAEPLIKSPVNHPPISLVHGLPARSQRTHRACYGPWRDPTQTSVFAWRLWKKQQGGGRRRQVLLLLAGPRRRSGNLCPGNLPALARKEHADVGISDGLQYLSRARARLHNRPNLPNPPR